MHDARNETRAANLRAVILAALSEPVPVDPNTQENTRARLLANVRKVYEARPPDSSGAVFERIVGPALDARGPDVALLAEREAQAAEITEQLFDAQRPEPYPVPAGEEQWTGPWPKRKWIIPGWLPLGRLGTLAGHGGTGKSRLALQLAAHVAGHPGGDKIISFLPGTPRGDALTLNGEHCGPVVLASWEDERDEIGRRIEALHKDALAAPAKLAARLRYIDMRGESAVWGPEDSRSGHILNRGALTKAGERLRHTTETLGAKLLILDSLAGAYAGDENSRALVRAFCANWDAWGDATGCTIMLISHPAKGQTDTYSGNTDWHNAPRWRWVLSHTKTAQIYTSREPDKDGTPTVKTHYIAAPRLTCEKASYGPQPLGGLWLKSSRQGGIGWEVTTEREAAQAEARRRTLALKREESARDDAGEEEEDYGSAFRDD